MAGSISIGLMGLMAQGPAFEVASVRQSTGGASAACHGGPGTKDPTRLTCTNVPLAMVLCTAYDKQFYEVTGPPWIKAMAQGCDIAANIPEGTSKEQYRLMLQNLLVDRFKIVMHHEAREGQTYSLTVDKNGAKMKPADPDSKRGIGSSFVDGHWHMVLTREPVGGLVILLNIALQGQVADDTGLKGDYTFNFDYTPQGRTPEPDGPADVFTELRSQLGLTLRPVKGSIDVLVVDRANAVPAAN